MLASFFFLQYYEMSYGLNIEMHKQVSFIQSQAKTTNESWFFNIGFVLWGGGRGLYAIFLPWFPSCKLVVVFCSKGCFLTVTQFLND